MTTDGRYTTEAWEKQQAASQQLSQGAQLRGIQGMQTAQDSQIGDGQSVVGLLNARIKRANAVIEILRVFYADPVRRAEEIADLALR